MGVSLSAPLGVDVSAHHGDIKPERWHDVEDVRLADPVLPCRLAEPDRLEHDL